MPERLYHSASSVALGARCMRAWWYQYIEGYREQGPTWAEIEAGASFVRGQRAVALGKAVHEMFESLTLGTTAPFDWESLPGQIAISGLHQLPSATGTVAEAEVAIGTDPMPAGAPAHAGPTRMRVHGVWWAGFRDLLLTAISRSERKRLGLPKTGAVLVDYKTTGSIELYSKNAGELSADTQQNLYALDAMRATRREVIAARWLYLETKGVRRALPVDVITTKAHALEQLIEPARLAKKLELLTCVDDATQNTRACGDYGGCPLHKSQGGPCDAHRSIGAVVQQQKRSTKPMPLTEKQKAAFAAAKAKTEEAVEEVEETSEEVEEPQRKKKVSKKVSKKAAKKAPAKKVGDDGVFKRLNEARAELAEAEHEFAEARDVVNAKRQLVSELASEIAEAFDSDIKED